MIGIVRGAVLGVIVSGCTVVPPTAPPAPIPTIYATVSTPEGNIGVVRDATSIRLFAIDASGAHLLTEADEGGQPPTVHLLTYGGETGRVGNTYVFGLVPVGTTRITMANGPEVGSAIERGLYVVVLEAKDLTPDDPRWTFLDATGAIIERGTGVRN